MSGPAEDHGSEIDEDEEEGETSAPNASFGQPSQRPAGAKVCECIEGLSNPPSNLNCVELEEAYKVCEGCALHLNTVRMSLFTVARSSIEPALAFYCNVDLYVVRRAIFRPFRITAWGMPHLTLSFLCAWGTR